MPTKKLCLRQTRQTQFIIFLVPSYPLLSQLPLAGDTRHTIGGHWPLPVQTRKWQVITSMVNIGSNNGFGRLQTMAKT